jgi:argininosuccinate lyase
MDEHFAKVLSRLQTHQKLFEEGLAEIYSTDTIVHYNLVDKEMMAQNAHRLYTETVIARVESKLNSVQKQLDHNEAVKTELFEKETRGQFTYRNLLLILEVVLH